MGHRQPLIVGIGGTVTPGAGTEKALGIALAAAGRAGARTMMFGGSDLVHLPHYLSTAVSDGGRRLVEMIRSADGLILASPAYHGSVSGLVKNAIDYIEETARDPRSYLDGVPVGLITLAYGWQATGSTLSALRSIVHALRGWPTPFGAGINSLGLTFEAGRCSDETAQQQLERVGEQVVAFASRPLTMATA